MAGDESAAQDLPSSSSSLASSSNRDSASSPGAAAHLLYSVLDEGHLIHNPASATSQAARQVLGPAAMHRLVLSGTPVQNAVGDLWSLFDFLMPGYLGEHAAFRRSIALPVAKAKSPTATEADVAAAKTALRSLHRSILPFVLRRMKGDVLADLPPKVVTDVIVDLTSAQRLLYDVIARGSRLREATWKGVRLREVLQAEEDIAAAPSQQASASSSAVAADVMAEVDGLAVELPLPPTEEYPASARGATSASNLASDDVHSGAGSVFTDLLRLQAVCDHPALLQQEVIDQCVAALEQQPAGSSGGKQADAAAAALRRLSSGAFDYASSCKLRELGRILLECGIAQPTGNDDEEDEDEEDGGDVRRTTRSGNKRNRKPASDGGNGSSRASKRRGGAGSAAATDAAYDDSASSSFLTAPPRKALVFSRFPAMLRAAETALLRGHLGMPSSSIAILDGSTPPTSRAALATKFNSSPCLRVLLLTTGVGGLGLNLTGADVVVFLDHDWNPAKDAQVGDC